MNWSASYLLVLAFQGWMAVHCVRTGRMGVWLWIILLLGPIGAGLYFVTEYWPSERGLPWLSLRAVSSDELRKAEAETRRLDNAAAWMEYAAALRLRKKHAEAERAAQSALQKAPADLHALYEQGRALLALGRAREAVAPLAQVVSRARGHDGNDALLALGRAHEASGDLASARGVFEELAERTSRPEILCHLGGLQEKLGDPEAARATYRRVVDEADHAPAFARSRVMASVRRARSRLKRL